MSYKGCGNVAFSFFAKGDNTMPNHKLLSLIDEMIYRDWYKAPSTYYGTTKLTFMVTSYKHWALNELRLYTLKHLKVDPITCIENFRNIVDDLACNAETTDSNFIYSTCYDVATDVLDMLLVS